MYVQRVDIASLSEAARCRCGWIRMPMTAFVFKSMHQVQRFEVRTQGELGCLNVSLNFKQIGTNSHRLRPQLVFFPADC